MALDEEKMKFEKNKMEIWKKISLEKKVIDEQKNKILLEYERMKFDLQLNVEKNE